MKLLIIIVVGFLASNTCFSQEIASDISCSFQKSDLKIELPNFKPGYQTGSSPLKEATFTTAGKKVLKTSVSAAYSGRSSWVEGDLQDNRPATTVDFEDGSQLNRLSIYYCAGDGKKVEAKLFIGKAEKQKASSFKSSQVLQGFCEGENLTRVFTVDCAAFK